MTSNARIVEEYVHRPFSGFAEILDGSGPVLAVANIKPGFQAVLGSDLGFDGIEASSVHVIKAAEPAAFCKIARGLCSDAGCCARNKDTLSPARSRHGLFLLLISGTDRPLQQCQTTSIPTSRLGAECVSAPTEIKSTPVSAIAATVPRLTPPDASSVTRP